MRNMKKLITEYQNTIAARFGIKPKSSIDEVFIADVLAVIKKYSCEFIKHRISGTSHYFSFFPIDNTTGLRKDKWLIYLHISNYFIELKNIIKRKEQTLRQVKQLTDWTIEDMGNVKQRWKIHSIIINDKCYNYDSALDAIDERLSQLSAAEK